MRARVVCLLLLTTACDQGFTPYSEIDRLRVLALGADRPWLRFSETASISALVVQARGDDAPLTWEWSWCPITSGNDRAFECAFTEEELQQQIDDAVGPGVVEVPPYALGTTSTVTFAYDLSPLLFRGLCDAIAMQALPDFVAAPECEGTFPITIRLSVGDGDEEVVAIRELELVYDDSIRLVNTNPIIRLARADTSTIGEDGSLEVERDVDVDLSVELLPMIEEEEIVISWFVETGTLDTGRTIDRDNVWHTPRAPDYPERKARLFFVARDDRRGVSWLRRTVTLREPQ
jgi:hypothetical protein